MMVAVPDAFLPTSIEACATPMAWIDAGQCLRALNPALREWLGAPLRRWRGEALALLDAKPPALGSAVERAVSEQRRVWLRGARLRTAIGDRDADLALTPLDAGVLLELQPAGAEGAQGQRLSESLRGFAHEVRNPLAGMRGAAQLLQRRLDSPELAELAALIIDEADRLASLADHLLHSGAKPRLAPTNVHEVLERVAALVGTDSPLALRRDYDPSLPRVGADAGRLQQALLNVARNAVEAGASHLLLRTRIEHAARLAELPARHALRIDLVDDGPGVPARLASTLFEPLVSGRTGGSGLGLAIAREIAREHGGDLRHAGRPGETVFSLLLPLPE
jgi:two-component system, NtrC family, nitrogen regulation sensor histidine kinase GlnL